jgi:heptaprenyl diphosphate synthase
MSGQKINMKKLALAGMLTAVAATLSVLERFFPLQAIVPLPGIKLGLANVVTMFALFFLDFKTSTAIVLVRCILGAALGGGPTGLLFSLTGSTLALLVMALLMKGYGRVFSLFGISIAGAAMHNLGQVLAAMAVLGDPAILAYLPVLMATGLATGALTAAAATPFFMKFKATGIVEKMLGKP